ncbi:MULTISPECIES: hypothetical protein [unclassified Micromonospora]|uniref:hypothetical protein n=1 Tax=unclassified Micromonospora TaxID=2617518 RepID=UPI0020B2309B|nr:MULTISPECIES: hypothetical protein [unclassified Micromonospora]MDM4779583.1 hypothetical protein [Micromonospora sp. b486]
MPPTDLLRVRDLVPDFVACAGRGAPELLVSRYLAGHPDVVRALRRDGDWSDAAGVASVLDGLRDRAADLAARAETVRASLPDGVAAVADALGWSGDGGPVECVVLVGLNQANGWAGELNGRYAFFLAVEQLGPPGDLDLLVRHEAAHVVHDRSAAIREWPEYGVANALFTEGSPRRSRRNSTPGGRTRRTSGSAAPATGGGSTTAAAGGRRSCAGYAPTSTPPTPTTTPRTS